MVFGLTYIGSLIYVANLVEAARYVRVPLLNREAQPDPAPLVIVLRWLLYGIIALTFFTGLLVLQTALIGDTMGTSVSVASGLIVFIIALMMCALSYQIVVSENVRQWFERVIAPQGTYNPNSSVHNAAFILMLSMIVWTLVSFVLQGGISGMAEDLAASSIEAGDLLFQAVLQVVVALLGVGLAIRRDWLVTAERLGLRLPNRDDLVWGVGLGIACIVMMLTLNAIWVMLTSPEIIAEQTAATSQMNQMFATLPMAFTLAITAAIGEEIWVRGALQPIFGIVLTSVFFVVLHTQVTLTPGTLVIFLVSLVFGWLRQRHSTTAAIIAHFTFNFIPLALLSIVPL